MSSAQVIGDDVVVWGQLAEVDVVDYAFQFGQLLFQVGFGRQECLCPSCLVVVVRRDFVQ